MRSSLLTGCSIAALILCGTAQSYAGPTITGYIYGEYDTGGIGDLPTTGPAGTNGLTWVNNGGHYDTPALFFLNPSSSPITDATMVLTDTPSVNNGWNTLNNGKSETVSLGTLGANSVTEIAWGVFGDQGTFFQEDYDDMYSSNYGNNPFPGSVPGVDNGGSANADCTLTFNGGPDPQWQNFCSPVGNFHVAFTGLLDGTTPVEANFGEFNLANQYVGWEGVDPNGWSENATYDVHNGTVSGVLADICLSGCSSPVTGVPEPGALSLLAAGLGALAMTRRRRKSKSQA